MSSLNKLAIRGIRSFDDKSISVIEFFSPVTVIVGHNGSGKTTVIECLKYASTGDQPPGTRGGAFIHDPKMANEKEVKAQVKLRFVAANGNKMLAVRNLSVTVKKNGAMTMKTLESILGLADANLEKGGKRGVISTKCAEMDNEIPHLLGVSRAVLDNVIFCHQEESYWPLSEPSTLKKKFDDIFEATKYTKALDNIKTLRKDRVADLKVEKERLEGLAREKRHADKLRSNAADLTANIASKQVELDETQRKHAEITLSNKRFLDQATHFREIYIRAESAAKNKDKLEEDLKEALSTIKEVDETDEQLQSHITNFNAHIANQKRGKREQEAHEQDMVAELRAARRKHVELTGEQGQLVAEANAQQARITEREGLVRALATQNGVRGYGESQLLDERRVADFTTELGAMQRRHAEEVQRIQTENRARDVEYGQKLRKAQSELDSFKHKRTAARESISKCQREISSAEARVEAAEMLEGELETHIADMEEKRVRIEKVKAEIAAARYDERISELNGKMRDLEGKRDAFTQEIRTLSLQADQRAKLGLHQSSVTAKTRESKNLVSLNNVKFRKLVGKDAEEKTMEREVDGVLAEKEREGADADVEFAQADRDLHAAENKKNSLQQKFDGDKARLKVVQTRVTDALQYESEDGNRFERLSECVENAQRELSSIEAAAEGSKAAKRIWTGILKKSQNSNKCTICERHTSPQEFAVIERTIKAMIDRIDKTTEENGNNDDLLKFYDSELKKLQDAIPLEAERDRLRDTDIPNLEREIRDFSASMATLEDKASSAAEKVATLKKELKDLAQLKKVAADMTRLQADISHLTGEIQIIEADLASTGTTKTPDDVQRELDNVSTELRSIDREKQTIMNERERRNKTILQHTDELHSLELKEGKLRSGLAEKQRLLEDIASKRSEIEMHTERIKELDVKIEEAQGPIELLEREHEEVLREANERLSKARDEMQAVNLSVQKLEDVNKVIERYVREKRARKLHDCENKIKTTEEQISQQSEALEALRKTIADVEKEINEGGAVLANLRDNMRMRRLRADIAAIEAELNSMDLDEAAKAKRNFEQKFPAEQKKEQDLAAQNSYIGGELNSLKAQLKVLEKEVKEYKDINQKYTDQLVKVKMSDMANNDLEKYAKALDNAIMHYHSMKMSEVNDTMRHLWNKTYQGTDIDGIKIVSDSEGNTTGTKRSYNYRVVMTKDQVEMDMRGRCSAGQKMLASIIIRLALSDSFGQNCGILALDEPTNALDTENIDALASSLVDIINERKGHSNFQLIIITHDENFLRKLGQADVMEYYWRVSRDARQKSIIERQRFG
ncbi:hypothetical protein PENSPDRAFT_655878 [Peniophora sp. CONT]|nr:hypothetical protein PENSPDRAFT_655878 [Peniophora sp. CONT]